jgi:hypothetical protein
MLKGRQVFKGYKLGMVIVCQVDGFAHLLFYFKSILVLKSEV